MWLLNRHKEIDEKSESECNCGCKNINSNQQQDEIRTDHWELASDISIENSDVTNIYSYIFGNMLMETEVYDGIKCELYQCKISQIINEISIWRSEPLDLDYVILLKKDLKNMKIPHLMGSIKIMRSKNDENAIKLIDGWHRCQALYELYQESDKRWDMELLLEIYYLNDLEICDHQMNTLFVGANRKSDCAKTKNLMMPDYKITKVINRIINKWPNCIQDYDFSKMPKISKKRLYNVLKNYVLNSQQDDLEIYEEIYDMNQQIGNTKLLDLFNTTHPTVTQMKIYKTAKEMNFYLNMHCTRSLDVWISDLENV